MALSTQSEANLLKLLFQNTDWGKIGDTPGLRASATPGSFFVGLHINSAVANQTQGANETTYTGYSGAPANGRPGVARSAAKWSVTNNVTPAGQTAQNVDAITFSQCTGGATQTLTFFTVGLEAYPTNGEALWYGDLTAPLNISAQITPSFSPGNLKLTIT